MADVLKETLRRQRSRVVASILSFVEAEFAGASPASMDRLRECVRASIGVYHDLVCDLLGSSSSTDVLNEHAVRLLEQIADQNSVVIASLRAI